ncbi:MAG: hypothetical protein AB1643_03075 [Patescibacteria group bacterium]
MKNKNIISIILSMFLSVLFVAVAAYAATTIGTNINTGGTLTVTGAVAASSTLQVTGATTLYSTLNVSGLTTLGNASTTLLSISNTGYVGGANGLILADGSITDASGAISFGDENLSTTGIINFATASSTGLASLDSVKISSIGDTISDIQFGTCTVTIGSVAASSTAVANCTATGVTTSHRVFVTPYITNAQIIFSSASSTADNIIQIAVYNTDVTGAVDPADNTWSWMAIK